MDGGKQASFKPFQKHLQRVEDYLWVAEDGMKMQGYNGSQCWDTSFAAQVGLRVDGFIAPSLTVARILCAGEYVFGY